MSYQKSIPAEVKTCKSWNNLQKLKLAKVETCKSKLAKVEMCKSKLAKVETCKLKLAKIDKCWN